MMKSLLAHFFLADMRDGLGPFLGVFLQEKAWSPAEIRPGCTTKSCHGPSKVANADNTAEDTRRCSGFTARALAAGDPKQQTNGIGDRMQIMQSGLSRKSDGAARPPDAAGACI
jgi:hypothetical protein